MHFFKGFLCTVIICNIFMVPSYSEPKENIKKQLSEILSNISAANKKLKYLLNNNNHLRKNNYKSIKALKNESSDSENNQLYKSIASEVNENKKAKRKHQGLTTHKARSHKVQVTAAIYDSFETSNRPTQEKGKIEIEKYDENETHSEDETLKIKVSEQETHETEVSQKPKSKNVKIHNKTRFDVKNNRDEKNDGLEYNARANDSRRIKKVVHFETFPKDKMWHDVARKPIAYNRQRDQQNIVNNLISLDTGGDLPAAYFEESEEEGNVIQLNVLRDKYGDACIYVAVRKCYKALRLVKKDVCDGRHRCNTKKRSTFDFKSRTGCIQEFGNEGKNKKTIDSTPIQPPTTTKNKKNNYPGACRSLDAAEYLNLQQVTSNISSTNLNILRDKYEDRCREISSRKCIDACTFAYKETCTAFKCRRSEEDAFKRRCKVRCKEEYIMEMSSEDKSKTDTYTDTDKDTETETDTDTDTYTD